MQKLKDVDVARCLRRLGVYPNKSIDNMGRERFHCLDVGYHYLGGFPGLILIYFSNKLKIMFLFINFKTQEWLVEYALNPLQTVKRFLPLNYN